VKSLAKALAPRIRVIAIAPGAIAGSSTISAMSPGRQQHHLRESLTGEMLSADDLAAVMVDLTRPHWRQLNGNVVRLNGGAYV
jgi:NAD(P)-dependent dehydrogenase (short-subunit alcohol dehydrogenase family)